jgi:Pectate lyase superfamily protein
VTPGYSSVMPTSRTNAGPIHLVTSVVAIVVVVALISVGAWYALKGSNHATATSPASSSTFGAPKTRPAHAVSTRPTPPPAGAFLVTSYGADPTGRRDSDQAIKMAIAAAEAKGGNQTVYFPAGTYILNDPDHLYTDLVINGSVNILGAGQSLTKVIEEVGNAKMVNGKPGPYPTLQRGEDVFTFGYSAHNFYFSGLTVDAQTYNAGDALQNRGSYGIIENSTFLGSINGPGSAGLPDQPLTKLDTFDIRIANYCNQSPTNPNYVGLANHHSTGNIVRDVTLISAGGVGGNDDLDFTCQEDGSISNITDTGWGTALYLDTNVTVDNYNFFPGSDTANRHYFAGWFVTDGHNITISNFTSTGNGGEIYSPNYPSSDITINNDVMKTPGYELDIGDATGVTINGGYIQKLLLAPSDRHGASSQFLADGVNGLTVKGTHIVKTLCMTPAGAAFGSVFLKLSGVSCSS